MKDRIVSRKPGAADAAALAEMVDELNRHEGEARVFFTAETALSDVIAPDAALSCLIAERRGAPVGYALWHFAYDTSRAARGSFLADLYVREEARGEGVGAALLREVALATKAVGGRHVWWTAYRSNDRARAFYRRSAEEDGLLAYALDGEAFERLTR